MKSSVSGLESITPSIEANPSYNNCPSCKNENTGIICQYCGEDLKPKRITVAQMLMDIPDVFFNVEHGLFYTMRSFLKRPGQEIKNYFAGDRKKHYKPLKFVLFIGGLTTLIYSHYKFNDGGIESELEEFGNTWNSMLLLLQFPMISFVTWLIYKNRKYTFGEHLVANAFIIGEVSLFNILLFPFYYMSDGTQGVLYVQSVYILSIVAYYTYSFYDWFYNRKGRAGIFKSLALVLMLVVVIFIITYILQIILFVLFRKLGWA